MSSFEYISERFLTMAQLVNRTGVKESCIIQMIKVGCLPGPAYRISLVCEIGSIFGEHKEQGELCYFPPSYIEQVKAVQENPLPFLEQAKKQKRHFIQVYKALLVKEKAREYGLGHLFDGNGRLEGAETEAFLDAEWQHYLDGTYGLCTRSASYEEIAVKEIMIARIKHFTALIDCGEEVQFSELEAAVDQLDAVSSDFAPHERNRSSRGQWIETVRRQYLSSVSC